MRVTESVCSTNNAFFSFFERLRCPVDRQTTQPGVRDECTFAINENFRMRVRFELDRVHKYIRIRKGHNWKLNT